MLEKRRFRNFLIDVQNYVQDTKKIQASMTMKQVFEAYGLDNNTQDFVGHALALHLNEE